METIYRFIAKHLPIRLKYFVVIDACAMATTGKYGDTEVPKLKVIEMLDRLSSN